MRIQNFIDFIMTVFIALLGAFYIWISAAVAA